MARLFLVISLILGSGAAVAQATIDPHGFYRSWFELNKRYNNNEVVLNKRGLESNTDTLRKKLSTAGLYLVSIEPMPSQNDDTVEGNIPFNQIHTWRLQLKMQVEGLSPQPQVAFFGGMPLHNHGFPTQPNVAATAEPGVYRLSGVKFSMPGWWQFALAIKTKQQTDTVRFNLVIQSR